MMAGQIVVTYERVSSDKQDIERQAVQRERARADYPDAEHVVIQDDGVSATKHSIFDRPGGAEVCALVATGNVAAIYTDAQDRLGRQGDVEWVNFRDLCDMADTWIVVDGRRIERDLGGKVLSYITALQAQQEQVEKGRRVASKMRLAASQGKWLRHAPFGYRLGPDQRLVLHATEAEVVRRVFREYLEGRGITAITKGLRDDGVKTRRGALLSLSRVGDILARSAYTGALIDGDEVLCEDAHPAIIDRDTFDAAQRLRATRSAVSKGRGSVAKRHLLQGLLRCPHGHAMICRGGKHDSYICGVRHAYGECDCPEISRAKVDQTILDHFLNRHWDEEEERAKLVAIGQEKAAEAIALATAADREEAQAEAALARVKADYKRGAITAEQWAELEAELTEEALASRNRAEQLRARAELVSAEVNDAAVETELLMRLARTLQVAAGKGDDDEESVASMRAALGSLFSHVTLSPGMAAWDAGETYVSGQVDLVPVLHEDVVPNTRQGGGWVRG